MNQSKLDVVKQELARVNFNILVISDQNGEDCVNTIQFSNQWLEWT